ncbi:CotH kinase family protein [Alkalitalea saponilacus]|uniref:Por secretion system C-terminal sorting domain-containing protein n=1 Tax=Alkalitalea saponilacus TaxID=889453 RepID=A0A1T5AKF4_9BACT|nr:CotH kinase family protein [Alkalitalea saponilacus]ASB48670.1 hypothetical protein CDL62_05695 [Alkalitalea saponilacus]SKB35484.1 Por secretion system C-terminal sorting domain-containing protein [Alkalitalea saponilacus]
MIFKKKKTITFTQFIFNHNLLRKSLLAAFIFASAFFFFNLSAQHIRINEVMASNSSTISDEDGSFEDWIEIINIGDQTINLKGYGLSDDYNDIRMWIFPDYLIEPGEKLIVWASGKDRKPIKGAMNNGIKRRFYDNIPGNLISDLTNHSDFSDNPTLSHIITSYFESPINIGDNYGQHMFTWIKPPQTGEYRFWISGDDNSELHLSIDASKGNTSLIASVPDWTNPRQWDKYPSQTSLPVYLEEGKLYYLSALMKEAQGGDHLSVRWRMPDGTIDEPINAQYCYVPGGFLHTNFKIDASGEEIVLTNPQGFIIDQVPPTPIPSDISYGRYPDGSGLWYYFENPTPGNANPDNYVSGLSAKPAISPSGGIYKENIIVSLSSNEGATIRYTTNGSEPTTESPVYENPITISQTTQLRAAAFEEAKLRSETVSANFSITHKSLEGFSSNLPVMTIFGYNTPITPGSRTPAYMVITNNENEGRNEITDIPEFQSRIIINKRGSSSLSFPKNNYGFHIQEEDGSNRKVSLLGLPEEHNWVLHGPYSDKTLMRNAFSYGLSNEIGQYSPYTRFVELFIHTGTGTLNELHYHGVYLLTQRIKVAPGNVNIQDLKPWHNNHPEITGGYIFKNDRLNPGESGFYTNRNSHFAFVRPDEATITPQQKDYLVGYIDSLETALFGNDFKDPKVGYRAFLDVPSFIDMHLITEVTKEIDGYRLSTFFTKERGEKIKSGPLWDFNLSLGNANYNEGWSPEGWYGNLLNQEQYLKGWYTRLFEDEEFRRKYNKRYRSLRTGKFSNAFLKNKILSYYDLLGEAQVRNFDRWRILGRYIWPNWFIGNTYEEEVFWMIDWLEKRLEWIDTQLGEPFSVIHYWNFNNENNLLFPSYTIGEGSVYFLPGDLGEITSDTGQGFAAINAKDNDPAGSHLRINNPLGSAIVFNLPSTGYQDLLFAYETRRSGSGANRQYLSYTTDGIEFIPFDTINVTDVPVYHGFDLALLPETDNNENLAIKISMDFDESDFGGTTGNNRIDNVSLEGEPFDGTVQPPIKFKYFRDPLKLIENSGQYIIDLSDFFSQPQGLPLTYSVEISNENVLEYDLTNSRLTINPVNRGGTTILISASDGQNPPIEHSFYTIVYPEAVDPDNTEFNFNYWDANAPEGTFPNHIIFMQSDTDDPVPSTKFQRVYHIPEQEFSSGDQNNIGFPYRNESRTRINGLGENGISFINTGRGRDLGALVLAINTQNSDNIVLNWSASTLRANSRAYRIRLQYRTEIGAEWKNWKDIHGNKKEYYRSFAENEIETFENIVFPKELLNKDYVQLRWLFYHTGERVDPTSGARDMLAIHSINISGPTGIPGDYDESNLSELRVYPNPVNETFINFSERTTGRIFNMAGVEVGRMFNKNVARVGHLPGGIYIYQEVNTGRMVKFIIQ